MTASFDSELTVSRSVSGLEVTDAIRVLPSNIEVILAAVRAAPVVEAGASGLEELVSKNFSDRGPGMDVSDINEEGADAGLAACVAGAVSVPPAGPEKLDMASS